MLVLMGLNTSTLHKHDNVDVPGLQDCDAVLCSTCKWAPRRKPKPRMGGATHNLDNGRCQRWSAWFQNSLVGTVRGRPSWSSSIHEPPFPVSTFLQRWMSHARKMIVVACCLFEALQERIKLVLKNEGWNVRSICYVANFFQNYKFQDGLGDSVLLLEGSCENKSIVSRSSLCIANREVVREVVREVAHESQ